MSPDLMLAIAALIAGPVAGAAASYGGVRMGLRFLEERVERLERQRDAEQLARLQRSRATGL